MRLTYGGHQILTDPFLSEAHELESFGGISRNPTVPLPISLAAVIAGTDLVIVSHLHSDHFDAAAQEALSANVPIFCQPGDAERILEVGIRTVRVVEDELDWKNIKIKRTIGVHGSGVWAERMGVVSGFLFRASGEPSIYWAGDTIWYQAVAEVIATHKPDVIITHSSGARFKDSDPIVMDAEQTLEVCRAAPDSIVVAIHMEALDHGTVTRLALHETAKAADIPDAQLRIPADGESLEF